MQLAYAYGAVDTRNISMRKLLSAHIHTPQSGAGLCLQYWTDQPGPIPKKQISYMFEALKQAQDVGT